MSMSDEPFEGPYVGLEPFEASHAEYFFGRRRDSKIIADHVIARPTTILYGPSGVGKTSLLNVGLSGALPQREGWIVVCLRDWQDPSQLEQLAIDRLLAELPRVPYRNRDRIRFVPLVAWAIRTTGRPIVLILDQFEEYFRYRNSTEMRELETAVGDLISRRDLAIHLLISVRDDALFELDKLRAFAPAILDTTIRLGHLSEWDVEEAIRGPITRYNEKYRTDRPRIEVETGLVTALIQQLNQARPGFGNDASQADRGQRIELPYLQLTLKKLWETEGGETATKMREVTLTDPRKLGGVSQIMRDHVNLVMEGLTLNEQNLCAKMFDRLVTSIGSKIAYPTAGLASAGVVGSGVTLREVEAVLWKLTPKESRILKPALTSGGPGFEIFHGVLGVPVLEWRQAHQARARSLQLYSTRNSVENEVPSVIAIFETISAISAYWWSAIYFDTNLALLVGVFLAPFVLLQSSESIALKEKWSRRWLGGAFEDPEGENVTRFLTLLLINPMLWLTATLVNLGAGVRNLPRNFRRLTLCTSILQRSDMLSLLPRRMPPAVAVLLIIIYFVPRFACFFVLKSTAWFWWPLAFVGSDLTEITNPELLRYRVLESFAGKYSIVLSIITIIVFLLANFVLSVSPISDNPLVSILAVLFVVDWNQPSWQLLPLLLALLNVAIVFFVDSVSAEYRHARLRTDSILLERSEAKFRWIARAARVRLVLTILFFLITGGETLLYFNSRNCWFGVSPTVERWGLQIYGNYYPRQRCVIER